MRTVNCWSRNETIWPRMTWPSFRRIVSPSAEAASKSARASAESARGTLRIIITPPCRGGAKLLRRPIYVTERDGLWQRESVRGCGGLMSLRARPVARFHCARRACTSACRPGVALAGMLDKTVDRRMHTCYKPLNPVLTVYVNVFRGGFSYGGFFERKDN